VVPWEPAVFTKDVKRNGQNVWGGHFRMFHQAVFATHNPQLISRDVVTVVSGDGKLAVVRKFDATHRKLICHIIARWLASNGRPLSVVADVEFKELCVELSGGQYVSPRRHDLWEFI
jgi:hypothetical protein